MKPDKVRTHVKLPKTLVEKLEAEKERIGLTKTAIIILALNEYFEKR